VAAASPVPEPPPNPAAPGSDNRTALLFCALVIGTHIVLSGGRVIVSLGALAQGASTLTVGMLMAVFALLPMLFAVMIGRLIDQHGVKLPLKIGVSLLIFSALLPVAFYHTSSLFISSCAIGIGSVLFLIAVQNIIGQGASTQQRVSNFARFSLAMSISGFSGPLIAGLAIDSVGHRWTFAIFALFPLCTLLVLRKQWKRVPATPPRASAKSSKQGGIIDLVRPPQLRRVFIATSLVSGAWDIHSFMVPLLGTSLGLSATTIGIILSTFALATFLIRTVLPWIQRMLPAWTLLRGAMLIACVVYLSYPFASAVPVLMTLSFVLGLALGSGQPSLMALIHTHAPPGRVAEALGLRMAMINGGQFLLPLATGAFSAVAGLGLPFWIMGAALFGGAAFIQPRKSAAPQQDERG